MVCASCDGSAVHLHHLTYRRAAHDLIRQKNVGEPFASDVDDMRRTTARKATLGNAHVKVRSRLSGR